MGDGSGEGACGRGDVGCDGDEARKAAVGVGAGEVDRAVGRGEGDRGERGMEGQRCEGLCFGAGLLVGVDLVERGTPQLSLISRDYVNKKL